MNDVIAIIPARSGSKGVPDKNIMNLCGHSLLEWSIIAAKNSNLIDRVFVSTDSQKYADLAVEFGAEAPFLRPKEISGDLSSDLDFVLHALREFKNLHLDPKYIAHIRPTTPLRESPVIDQAIEFFKMNPDYTSLRSVHKMSESAYKTFEISNDILMPLSDKMHSDLDSNAPRQLFPETFQANGYIDILSVEFLNSSNSLHGKKILPFITNHSYEIDSYEDFRMLEYQAKFSHDIITKLFE